MKVLRSVVGVLTLIIILFSLQGNLSSCQKQVIVDTLRIKDTVRINDTLRIKDTIRIKDSSTCGCYNLNDGLVAYYNFNNGTLNDSSGYNNHIILNNNAMKTADRFGRPNNAYLFDGASSYMKVANSPSLNPANGITIMATIKIQGFYSANCVSNQIVGKGWNDYINGFYALRFSSTVGCQQAVDTSKETFNGSYGDLSSRSAIYDTHYLQSNRWYNVVYTSSAGVSYLYIDGVLQNTNASPSTTLFNANSQEMYIGKHGDPQYPYFFNGVIDEIRIYNKALCAGAIKMLYSATQ